MAKVEETEEHRSCRNALRRLEEQIISLETIRFGSSELQKAEIRTLPMTLNANGEPNFEPCFFNPYPEKLLIAPIHDDVLREFPEYGQEKLNQDIIERPIDCARTLYFYLMSYLKRYKSRSPDIKYTVDHHSEWYSNDIGEYGFRPLWEYNSPPEWGAEVVFHVRSMERPHMMCIMLYDVDGDDRLLRGELLALIRIMRGRLNTRSLVDHVVAPVLLFSLMGPQHARMLQGYFDGKNLVLHYSKLYDFRHEKDAPLNLFAQWTLSHPIGQTAP